MPRKFRLGRHRKNEFKRKSDCTLVVEHVPIVMASVAVSAGGQETLVAQDYDLTEPLVVSLPLEVVLNAAASSLDMMRTTIRTLSVLPPGWFDVSINHQCLVYSRIEEVDDVIQLTYTLKISDQFLWNLRIQGISIDLSSSHLAPLSLQLQSANSVLNLIRALDSSHICIGNEDTRFFPLQESRKGIFMDTTGSTQVATYTKDFFPYHTIRSTSCAVLLPKTETRCSKCAEHRRSLVSMLYRHSRSDAVDNSDPTSHSNYRFLSTPQKHERLRRFHSKVRLTSQSIRRIEKRLEEAIERRGVEIDDALHQDLSTIMAENSLGVKEQHPPGSFARIFWEQQEQASQLKNAKSMRWEPAMIRWCIYVRHLSSSAYELLRTSGILRLPSQRTLRDYTYHTKACHGFSATVDRQLMDLAKIDSCKAMDKYVIIIMDEMHIREDIVYDKHTGSILGFTNLGDLNNHLLAYEKTLDGEEKEEVAKSMMVIMVRGLFTKLQFAYAQFPCASVCGYHMYDIFWEAVERLERCGFKVLACTCDGLSVNRNFFKLHDKDKAVFKVLNPYAEQKRYIFFLSDPPHLMKTTRNCWASSKRLMWFDGKHIEWKHLVNLYHKCRPDVVSPGLTVLPKLKYEHISLTSFSKMRVDLAAQVLSNSVGVAMKLMQDPELEKTAEFILMFDKFFDCLNISCLDAGKHSRNAFKSPYHSPKDFRIKWLKEEFVGYLDKWEQSVFARKGFTKTEQNKMLLSEETRLGLRLTVFSFVELVEYVFTIPGVTVFLSNRICQDPLENFFGQQRQRGRVNENPNVSEFVKNTQALRVVNSSCATVRGNCRGARKKKNDAPLEVENTPLRKRKTKHK